MWCINSVCRLCRQYKKVGLVNPTYKTKKVGTLTLLPTLRNYSAQIARVVGYSSRSATGQLPT